MTLTPIFPATLRAEVDLPASKSLGNRALLLKALGGGTADVEHLSDCDDTRVMRRALEGEAASVSVATVDIMAAGTAMRFLTACFSLSPGLERVVTGTRRMKERPVSVLVDALRSLGADISYEENEGFPPLRIRGKSLPGGTVTLPADVSSQYISALLMAAPVMEQGLTLHLVGDIISRPYIEMTRALMHHFGARTEWLSAATLAVCSGGYAARTRYVVESDWSAASYWYELVALSPDPSARVLLRGLRPDSLQGDSAVQRLFEPLGVSTAFTAEGVELRKSPVGSGASALPLTFDLSSQPDLAQALVVTCALLRRPFRFTGLRTLRIKETDRLAALSAELRKFGISLTVTGDDALSVAAFPEGVPCYNGVPIATYHDHRMAMSFAPAALCCSGVSIADPDVVSKSYPAFWAHLRQAGVECLCKD